MREGSVAEPGSRIGDRYRVEAVLGVGGMGSVYRVLDESTDTRVALKQARTASEDPRRANNLAAAFEREYYTLAELAHPCVISVHDYGLDAGGAFYTMELLDGTDLRERAPLPWRTACSIVRDVASSLALLHARKLVHRDLSPRNVRCTSDGRAKLIDFGAMTPFGPALTLVGTPAYVAPETLWGQPLDARTDLFALGALAYYAVVGHHAYPAQRMPELRQMWATPPALCSALVPEIPQALDALIMALLALDPLARPATAAEVVSKLSAIAGLPPELGIGSAHGYLTTPSLVGRSQPLASVAALLTRTMRAHGGTVIVSGAAGHGRSRFLDSVALQTKLAGALTLQLRVARLGNESLAVVREAVTELIDRKPLLVADTLAPYAQAIAPLLAEATHGSPAGTALADAAAQRGRVLEALVAWFSAIAERVPLALLIDDFESCDGATASFVAELALVAKSARLLIVLGACSDSGPRARAVETLIEQSDLLELQPLSREEIGELLHSIFGGAPNLTSLVDWVYRTAGGVPKHAMELAQHLLERGIVKLVDDVWHLPGVMPDQDLPASVEQATAARVQRLGPVARYLAQALSQVTALGALDLPELVALGRERYPASTIHGALDELTRAEILAGTVTRPVLSSGAIGVLLRATITQEELRALHSSLAKLYLDRGAPEVDALACHHFARAGALSEADALIRKSEYGRNEISGLRARFARTREGIALHTAMLEHAQREGFPPSEIYARMKMLVHLAAVADPALARHAPAALRSLERDTGICYLPETDSAHAMADRVSACFQRAVSVFEATPEHARGLHPTRALVELANLVIALGSIYARTWDVSALERLPGLLAPFHAPPAVELVQSVLQMVSRSIGRGDDCREQRRALLDRLTLPVEGVDGAVQQTARVGFSYYLGLDLAMRGDACALEYAELIERSAPHVALAWHVRGVYYGHSSDARDMERCKHHMEAQLLGHETADPRLSVGKVYTLHLAVRVGDLLTLSRELPGIDAESERFPGWRPWQHYYCGAHHVLRGEPAPARQQFELGLALAPPGRHYCYQHLAPAYVQVLIDSGEYARALEVAREHEAAVRALGLSLLDPTEFEVALGLAEAYAGELGSAQTRLHHALHAAQTEPRSTLSIGVLHEACARVARLRGETPALMQHARLAADAYRKLRRPALLARCERIVGSAAPASSDPAS